MKPFGLTQNCWFLPSCEYTFLETLKLHRWIEIEFLNLNWVYSSISVILGHRCSNVNVLQQDLCFVAFITHISTAWGKRSFINLQAKHLLQEWTSGTGLATEKPMWPSDFYMCRSFHAIRNPDWADFPVTGRVYTCTVQFCFLALP